MKNKKRDNVLYMLGLIIACCGAINLGLMIVGASPVYLIGAIFFVLFGIFAIRESYR